MTPEQFQRLLRRRERATLEFKEARRDLPRSLFETVCAFLNRDGGTILLGVADDGTVTGVEPGAVERLTESMQMGRGEELGSGVLNVSKYLPFYSKGAKPRFVEGDPFVTIIPLPVDGPAEGASDGVNSSLEGREKTREKTREKILDLLRKTPSLTTAELAVTLGITDKGVAWQLNRLQQVGRLRRIGPDKGGHWEVISPTEGAHG